MGQQNAVRVSIGEGLKRAAGVPGATAAGERAHAEGLALFCQPPLGEPATVLCQKLERIG